MDFVLKVGDHHGRVGDSGLHGDEGRYGMKTVSWIKAVREELHGIGLKEAKNLADALRDHCESSGAFINKELVVSSFEHPALNNYPLDAYSKLVTYKRPQLNVETEPASHAVLRKTAIKLTNMGAYSEAGDVLYILKTAMEEHA